jgi:hypothetical protein
VCDASSIALRRNADDIVDLISPQHRGADDSGGPFRQQPQCGTAKRSRPRVTPHIAGTRIPTGAPSWGVLGTVPAWGARLQTDCAPGLLYDSDMQACIARPCGALGTPVVCWNHTNEGNGPFAGCR